MKKKKSNSQNIFERFTLIYIYILKVVDKNWPRGWGLVNENAKYLSPERQKMKKMYNKGGFKSCQLMWVQHRNRTKKIKRERERERERRRRRRRRRRKSGEREPLWS